MKIINTINKSLLAQASNTTTFNLGWTIPSIADIIGFAIKLFFIIAGLAALIYLILGAFAWVTSSGDKENVSKAQQKIQAAVLGLIILVVVLAILVALERFVFNGKVCFGITCPITIPTLIQP